MQFLDKVSNILMYEILWNSIEREPSSFMQKNGQTDMTKTIVAFFFNLTNTPNIEPTELEFLFSNCSFYVTCLEITYYQHSVICISFIWNVCRSQQFELMSGTSSSYLSIFIKCHIHVLPSSYIAPTVSLYFSVSD